MNGGCASAFTRHDKRRRSIVLGTTVALVMSAVLVTPSPAEPPPVPCAAGAPVKVVPPAAGAYHGAFPFFSDPDGEADEDLVRTRLIRRFERLARKRIVWAYFSNHWLRGKIRFPATHVRRIWKHGALPVVRMMAWRSRFQNRPSVGYSLQKIIDGVYDGQLAVWAQKARATGIPMMVEFGTEVNGEWFPWNGRWHGGGRKDRYGDPSLPDGPERFRDAFRHIVTLFRAQNANNITWVFHADVESVPEAKWNSISNYYPGDAYVDWIGVSVYGAGEANERPERFSKRLAGSYDELTRLSPTKPLAIMEFGAPEYGRKGKARWITAAFRSIRTGRFPRVRAVSWWDERWSDDNDEMVDLDLASSRRTRNAYRRAVRSPFFVTQPTFRCG